MSRLRRRSFGRCPSYEDMHQSKPVREHWNKPNPPPHELPILCDKCHTGGKTLRVVGEKDGTTIYRHDTCSE